MTDGSPQPTEIDVTALGEALARYAPLVLRITATPGVSIAVTDRAGNSHVSAYGMANLADATRMRPESVFHLGSISKLYVSAAVVQLAERGLLDLHRPVNHYLDEFTVRNPLGSRDITAYDLLTHQSGLGTSSAFDATLGTPGSLAKHLADGYGTAEGIEYGQSGARWTAPVGARFQYTTFGMATLGHLVEVTNKAGLSFADYVAGEIIEPLGMTAAAIPDLPAPGHVPAALLDARATGYARFGRWCVPTPEVHTPLYPAGGMLGTAASHNRFLCSLMLGGRLDGNQILRPESVRAMVTPQNPAQFPGGDHGIGLGMELRQLGRPDFFFGHAGAYPFGWWSFSRVYPGLGFAVTVLSNAWDMARFFNPVDRSASGLITEFVANWVATGGGSAGRSTLGWDEQAAYAMGLLMGERLRGLFNIAEPLGPAVTDRMVAGARLIPAEGYGETWSADGFAEGVRALDGFEPSAERIRAFLSSPECLASAPDLDLHALEFGASHAEWPMPMSFWADRVEQNRALYGHLDQLGF
ncbi:serine hydrolase domain-containing protein [Streptomyces sp. NPDC048277]|uniref:serine hydrolase domain-containing protein n=1 Tax=Streptomyces sp. NPDC048277 TaxID=3155027 RepID=UPI00340A5B36